MITESRIKAIEDRLDELTKNFIQAQENQVPITEKTEDTSAQLKVITPYKETKTAYYGEKEKTFYNVPAGNTSVFFDGYSGSYSVDRVQNRLVVSFDPLEKETKITIMIQ